MSNLHKLETKNDWNLSLTGHHGSKKMTLQSAKVSVGHDADVVMRN